MANTGGISGRQDFAGRDDRLANEIIQTLRNIERTSRGSFDELVAQMTAARYSAVPAKIRKMNYLQLLSLRSLVLGYQSRVTADAKSPLETALRPELIAAAALTVPQVLSMRRADDVIQTVLTGLNGGDQVAHTFLPGNPSGSPDDTETLLSPAPAARMHFCKRNDQTLLFRNPDLNTDPELFSTTIDANGNFTAPATVATLTPTSGTHTDRGIIEDFCDGRNYWTCEYDDTNNTATIHKVNLTDGTITTQVVNNIDLGTATSNGFLFAIGDFCLLIAEDFTGPVTAFLAFELEDGATPGALDLDVGADGELIETAANNRLLGGYGGLIHTDGGPRYRGFFTAHAAEPSEAVHVLDFDPTAVRDGGAIADALVRTQQVLGQAHGWPVGTGSLGQYGVSPDGMRLVLIGEATLDIFRFSLERARQINAILPVAADVTTLDEISYINSSGANMGALITDATGQLALEMNA